MSLLQDFTISQLRAVAPKLLQSAETVDETVAALLERLLSLSNEEEEIEPNDISNVPSAGASEANAILQLIARNCSPSLSLTESLVSVLPVICKSMRLAVIATLPHVCSGTDDELHTLLSAFNELILESRDYAVPCLGSLSDLQLPTELQSTVQTLAEESLSFVSEDDYPAVVRALLKSIGGGKNRDVRIIQLIRSKSADLSAQTIRLLVEIFHNTARVNYTTGELYLRAVQTHSELHRLDVLVLLLLHDMKVFRSHAWAAIITLIRQRELHAELFVSVFEAEAAPVAEEYGGIFVSFAQALLCHLDRATSPEYVSQIDQLLKLTHLGPKRPALNTATASLSSSARFFAAHFALIGIPVAFSRLPAQSGDFVRMLISAVSGRNSGASHETACYAADCAGHIMVTLARLVPSTLQPYQPMISELLHQADSIPVVAFETIVQVLCSLVGSQDTDDDVVDTAVAPLMITTQKFMFSGNVTLRHRGILMVSELLRSEKIIARSDLSSAMQWVLRDFTLPVRSLWEMPELTLEVMDMLRRRVSLLSFDLLSRLKKECYDPVLVAIGLPPYGLSGLTFAINMQSVLDKYQNVKRREGSTSPASARNAWSPLWLASLWGSYLAITDRLHHDGADHSDDAPLPSCSISGVCDGLNPPSVDADSVQSATQDLWCLTRAITIMTVFVRHMHRSRACATHAVRQQLRPCIERVVVLSRQAELHREALTQHPSSHTKVKRAKRKRMDDSDLQSLSQDLDQVPLPPPILLADMWRECVEAVDPSTPYESKPCDPDEAVHLEKQFGVVSLIATHLSRSNFVMAPPADDRVRRYVNADVDSIDPSPDDDSLWLCWSLGLYSKLSVDDALPHLILSRLLPNCQWLLQQVLAYYETATSGEVDHGAQDPSWEGLAVRAAAVYRLQLGLLLVITDLARHSHSGLHDYHTLIACLSGSGTANRAEPSPASLAISQGKQTAAMSLNMSSQVILSQDHRQHLARVFDAASSGCDPRSPLWSFSVLASLLLSSQLTTGLKACYSVSSMAFTCLRKRFPKLQPLSPVSAYSSRALLSVSDELDLVLRPDTHFTASRLPSLSVLRRARYHLTSRQCLVFERALKQLRTLCRDMQTPLQDTVDDRSLFTALFALTLMHSSHTQATSFTVCICLALENLARNELSISDEFPLITDWTCHHVYSLLLSTALLLVGSVRVHVNPATGRCDALECALAVACRILTIITLTHQDKRKPKKRSKQHIRTTCGKTVKGPHSMSSGQLDKQTVRYVSTCCQQLLQLITSLLDRVLDVAVKPQRAAEVSEPDTARDMTALPENRVFTQCHEILELAESVCHVLDTKYKVNVSSVAFHCEKLRGALSQRVQKYGLQTVQIDTSAYLTARAPPLKPQPAPTEEAKATPSTVDAFGEDDMGAPAEGEDDHSDSGGDGSGSMSVVSDSSDSDSDSDVEARRLARFRAV